MRISGKTDDKESVNLMSCCPDTSAYRQALTDHLISCMAFLNQDL